MKRRIYISYVFLLFPCFLHAQTDPLLAKYSRADTLRGSITPERAWWNVLRYDITVQPDFNSKTIAANCTLQFRITGDPVNAKYLMQIDLQPPLVIDSILHAHKKMQFTSSGNVCLLEYDKIRSALNTIDSVTVYYHGKPREAVRPPWDGGWIWKKDTLGRPWMSVACQGLGSSAWYPCKDHQSDEPDNGASLTMIVPDTLVAVSNGRLSWQRDNRDGTSTYRWDVKSPINNYNLVPYIGKYVNFSEVYDGLKGKLDVNYWVMDYNLEKAKKWLQPEVQRMLKCFEYWMGPYPFYEDGYKLVDAPHLGMEHQSAVAYGNGYQNGYKGTDLSGTGQGLKWDFIVVHESGHEWFGNSITVNDVADEWIHEGFTNYSETLFTGYYFGLAAGDEYNFGIRTKITNKQPIIGHYGVNDDGTLDIYYKASNMIHTIRHSINDDVVFRNILTGLCSGFYHQTVNSSQVEDFINARAGFNYSKVLDQYLRTIQVPELQYYYTKDKTKICYRWANCIAGFNLPVVLKKDEQTGKIYPTQKWKLLNNTSLFDTAQIHHQYYISVKELSAAPAK